MAFFVVFSRRVIGIGGIMALAGTAVPASSCFCFLTTSGFPQHSCLGNGERRDGVRDETISFHSWFYTLFYHGEAERCHEYEEAIMDLLSLMYMCLVDA